MRFLLLYRECARRFNASGELRFFMRPKMHSFEETLLDIRSECTSIALRMVQLYIQIL